MQAVMGTMREMENPEMEDEKVMDESRSGDALDSRMATKKRNGRVVGEGSRGVDKWKWMAAYQVAARSRSTVSPVAISFGRRPENLPDYDRSTAGEMEPGTINFGGTGYRDLQSQDDVPMDLSRRNEDEIAGEDGNRHWSDEEDGEEHLQDGGHKNGGCRMDDRYAFARIVNGKRASQSDEPLNLSRSNGDAVFLPSGPPNVRWNASFHSTRSRTASSTASLSDDEGSSDEHVGDRNVAVQRSLVAPPELLQKRVRLEEMVSFIRKCSTADSEVVGGVAHGRHQKNSSSPATERSNGSHDWSRNGHHRHHHRRHYNRRPQSAADGRDEVVGNGAGSYDIYHEDVERDVEAHRNLRWTSESVGYDQRPAVQQHYRRQQFQGRRKSGHPYRGEPQSTTSESPVFGRSSHHQSEHQFGATNVTENGRPYQSVDYCYGSAEVDPTVRTLPRASNHTNGVRGITYPVLRQQLLGMSKRHPVSTQTTCSPPSRRELDDRMSTELDADAEEKAVEEDDAIGQPDIVRDHSRFRRPHHSARSKGHFHVDPKGDRSADDIDDGAPLLNQQLQLLSSAVAPTVEDAQSLSWSTYAYYANLFQGIQGSLAVGSNGRAPPATLPTMTLSLPSSAPGARSDSPGSTGDDDADTLDTSSPETPNHKSDGGNAIVDNRKSNGIGGGGLLGIAADVAAANAAMFRKRAPRALTGKHVKHGTGASPTTLLTLRQKIEKKRQQQQTAQAVTSGSGAAHKMQEKLKAAESNGSLHKAIKSGALLQKKKLVS